MSQIRFAFYLYLSILPLRLLGRRLNTNSLETKYNYLIKMKKFFSIFAIISLAFSFGCGGGEEKPADGDEKKEEAPAEGEKKEEEKSE